jgi:hypothetical protein
VRGGLILLLLTALPATPGRGEGPTPRFLLLESRDAETLERDLGRAAREGFRMLATAPAGTIDGKPRLVTLMERLRPGADAHEYAVLAPAGTLENTRALEALNALGAAGYRLGPRTIITRTIDDWWLPEESYDAQLTLVLERSAAPERYAYRSIRFHDPGAFEERLGELADEGFEVLAMVNSARRVRAILRRPLDAARPDARQEGRRYRVLFNARRHGMRKALKRSGAMGYRVVAGTEQSVLAPAMLLLELPAAPAAAHAYKVLSKPVKKHGKRKLEQKLNRRASRGFRVVPSGVTRTDLTLERRVGDDASAWQYRVLSSREPPGLERALDEAIDRGYRFVALFTDSIETVALVERSANPTVRARPESRTADRAGRAAR